MSATAIKKHSLVLNGHKTSVSLEEPFWECIRAAAARQGMSLQALVATIDQSRTTGNLSSALRLFALADAQATKAVA